MTTLAAKVNTGERQASIGQYACAGLIWGGVVFTLVSSIYAYFGRNTMFSISGEACPNGWAVPASHVQDGLCVTQGLLDDIHKKCSAPAYLEAMTASTEAPMTQWTLNLVTDIGVAGKQRSSNTLTLEEVAKVRGLTEDSIKEASFRLAASGVTEKKTMMQLLLAPHLLPLFLPLIILVAALWFTILHYHAQFAMWSTAASFVLGMVYVAFRSYTLGEHSSAQNGNDETNYTPFVYLGLTVVYIVMMVKKKEQINLGCSCLQLGLTAVMDSRFSLLIIVSTGVLQLIYTGLLVSTFIFTSMILHVSPPKAAMDDCVLHSVSGDLSYVFTFLFVLTSSFFTMVVVYTLSFGVGCWYFGEDANVPTPMVTGLKMALTTPNGTGATAQAGAVMALIESMAKQSKNCCNYLNPIFCLVASLYCCMRQVMESLCTFAVTAIAIHGGSFIETSRMAKDTLGVEKAGRFVLIDANLTWLLRMQALTISTIIGLLAFFAVDKFEFDGVIFSGIAHGSGNAESTWIVELLVLTFLVVLNRPVMTMGVVLLIHTICGNKLPTQVSAVFASIIVGCIGSIIFHQFAEAAKGSLDALLYCFSLDEANDFKGSSKSQHRDLINELMAKTKELEDLQPTTSAAAAREPMASADHLGQVGCIQP